MTSELKQVNKVLAKAKYALLAVLLIAVAVAGIFGITANRSTKASASTALGEVPGLRIEHDGTNYIAYVTRQTSGTLQKIDVLVNMYPLELPGSYFSGVNPGGTKSVTLNAYYDFLAGQTYEIKVREVAGAMGNEIKTSQIITITIRVSVSLPPNPTKDGHTFVGWYFDSGLTQAYDGRPIYADTQLYAKFEVNTYTVTYNADGGSLCDNASITWNTSAPQPTTTRAGHTFKGWFLPNGAQYTGQALTADTTLTARWEIIKYTVTFYVDGAVVATLEIEFGTPLKEAIQQANISLLNNFTLDGDTLTFDSLVEGDMQISVVETAGWERFANFAMLYWYWLLVALAVVVIAICVIAWAVKR